MEMPRPGTLVVPSIPLDRLLREAGSVELLKLDCEFAEYPILLASGHLRRVRRVAAECHEVPGLLEPEAYVGSIDVFRGSNSPWRCCTRATRSPSTTRVRGMDTSTRPDPRNKPGRSGPADGPTARVDP
jgi:hypothetical protein